MPNLQRIPMSSYQQPDASGHFGPYGGSSFVSETLTHAIQELREAYARYQNDPEFLAEFQYELAFRGPPHRHLPRGPHQPRNGRRADLPQARDLNHTGAHKINNVIGQAMLAKRMGKPPRDCRNRRRPARRGHGHHLRRYGLECVVYMGAEDVKRQSPNVYRMKLLGATVVPVESGSKTLKDALNDAMRDWVANVDNTFYIIGTVAGPTRTR